MKEYTKDELQELFLRGISEMGLKGLISPTEYKEFSQNIGKWLAEELDS